MKHQECNFALIEIGETEKTGYWFLQGEDWDCKDRTLAHTYWYPDNIRTGRFCDQCKAEMSRNLGGLYRKESPKISKDRRDPAKMRFLDN